MSSIYTPDRRMLKFITLIFLMLRFQAPAQRTMQLFYQPGIEKITLYSGVDFADKALSKKRAIQKIQSVADTTSKTPNISVHSYVIVNDASTSGSWDVDVKGNASMIFFKVKGDDSYTKNTTENRKNYKLRILVQSIYSPELVTDSPNLTHEANLLKDKTAEFIRSFGTYFCSAIYKGHYLMIDFALNNQYNSSLESYFHNGDLSVPLEVVDFGVQTKIKHDVQSAANASSASLDIETIGGPDIPEYKGIVDAMKSTSDFTSLYTFLSQLISKFNYKNAKTIECTLSDYSTWGIDAPALVRTDIQDAETFIKRLMKNVDKDLKNINAVFSNINTSKFYTDDEVKNAKVQYRQLTDLQNTLYTALLQLNYGDVKYLSQLLNYETSYSNIHRKIPEVFDYIASKGSQQIVSLNHQLGSNLDWMIKVLSNTIIYNTINSSGAFFNLKEIYIQNDLNQIVATNDASRISENILSKDTSITYFKLSDLFTSDQLTSFATNIFTSVDDIFRSGDLLSRSLGAGHQEYHTFNLTLVDKSDRKFIFPLISFTSEYFAPMNGRVVISEALPENCCLNVDNFQMPSISGKFSPQFLLLDLKRLQVIPDDTLIIKIRSTNSIVNSAIEKDRSFDIVFSPEQVVAMAGNPIIECDLKKYANQIDQLKISWKFEGKTASTKRVKVIDWKRKICNLPVVLD